MEFQQTEITGCRLVGAATKLGNIGPKHHGIVIGRNTENGHIYIAENCHTGYQLATYDEFIQRYSKNGDLQLKPNKGEFTDLEVAKRALKEVKQSGKSTYNLLFNNCESFSNRAMHDHSVSSQVFNALGLIAICIGGIWLIKQIKKA